MSNERNCENCAVDWIKCVILELLRATEIAGGIKSYTVKNPLELVCPFWVKE